MQEKYKQRHVLLFIFLLIITWPMMTCTGSNNTDETYTLCSDSSSAVYVFSDIVDLSLKDADENDVAVTDNKLTVTATYSGGGITYITTLAWQEGTTDFQITLTQYGSSITPTTTTTDWSVTSYETFAVAWNDAGTAYAYDPIIVLTSTEGATRTISGDFTYSFAYIAVSSGEYTCTVDCTADDDCALMCDCTTYSNISCSYTCSNGDTATYTQESYNSCSGLEDRFTTTEYYEAATEDCPDTTYTAGEGIPGETFEEAL